MRPRNVLALATLLITASGHAAPTAAPAGSEVEAVYAAALGFAAEQLLEGETAVCVALAGKDPSDAFLKRIEHAGPLRKGSDCETSAEGAKLRATGQPALWLATHSIDPVSADEIWVEVRFVRSGVKRGIRQYRVVRKSASWVTLGQVIKGIPL
jgi:hypothetical protein